MPWNFVHSWTGRPRRPIFPTLYRVQDFYTQDFRLTSCTFSTGRKYLTEEDTAEIRESDDFATRRPIFRRYWRGLREDANAIASLLSTSSFSRQDPRLNIKSQAPAMPRWRTCPRMPTTAPGISHITVMWQPSGVSLQIVMPRARCQPCHDDRPILTGGMRTYLCSCGCLLSEERKERLFEKLARRLIREGGGGGGGGG